VANKEINNSQCTIIWHVDDLKISHRESWAVDQIISLLEMEFSKEAPLTKTRGKWHDHLGMVLDFSTPGSVEISMHEYVSEIINGAPCNMEGNVPSPAATHLFTVKTKDPVPLDGSKAQLFHHIVAKLLFLCKRSRPDISTAITFLRTRVKGQDEDNYKELTHVIRYLRSTQHFALKLITSSNLEIKWWVDASFATHTDMQSHREGVMIVGKGAAYTSSIRQKNKYKKLNRGRNGWSK